MKKKSDSWVIILCIVVVLFICFGTTTGGVVRTFLREAFGGADTAVGSLQVYLGNEEGRYGLHETKADDEYLPSWSSVIGAATASIPEGATAEEASYILDAYSGLYGAYSAGTLTQAEAAALYKDTETAAKLAEARIREVDANIEIREREQDLKEKQAEAEIQEKNAESELLLLQIQKEKDKRTINIAIIAAVVVGFCVLVMVVGSRFKPR